MIADTSSDTMQARGPWCNILKRFKKKKVNLLTCNSIFMEMFFKNAKEIKTFLTDKSKDNLFTADLYKKEH